MHTTKPKTQIEISVIVPCFNSAEHLEETTVELLAACERLGKGFEVILVDDCSADGTWGRIVLLSDEHPPVRRLGLRKNMGQHRATLAGLYLAQGAVCVTVDDDGQYPASEISRLLEPLGDERVDLVYGRPSNRRQNFARQMVGRFFRRTVALVSGQKAMIYQTSFRAFRRSLVPSAPIPHWNENSVDALLLSQTSLVQTVEVDHRERQDGSSSYSINSLTGLAIGILANLSAGTLKALFLASVAFTFLSVVSAVALFFWEMNSPDRDPGFASLLLLMFVGFGFQSIFLGLLGIYVGKIWESLRFRP